MTAASDIITAAYRETNLIPLVATPNTNQQTEALNRLNPIILSSVGFEAGSELGDINIGGEFDQSFRCSSWIPANARLILNLSGATTLKLHPRPYEGQRIAIADAAGNLATDNLILDGNGRTIEDAATLTLNTDSTNSQWLYRADTGNWVKITSLVAADPMPFPIEFDDYFIIMLAKRLNPRYGQALAQETVAEMSRQRSILRARYRRPRRPQDMGSLGLLGQRWTGFESLDLLR